VDEIANQVAEGALRPGDRIPSVRELSRERGVSVTTVLEAYGRLEDRGIIRVRPQSGYFVALRPAGAVRPQPTMSSALAGPAPVTISDLDANILLDAVSQGMVPFGAAFPARELLPTDRMNRILGSLARRGEVGRYLHASPDGWEELRRQIALRRSLQGCALESSEVLVTTGCTESLSLALNRPPISGSCRSWRSWDSTPWRSRRIRRRASVWRPSSSPCSAIR
jgi:DNA-binding transcriptional MocR family regulator